MGLTGGRAHVRKARRPAGKKSKSPRSKTKSTRAKARSASPLPSLKFVRFAGVALGGGKTDKTAVAVLEYFPEQKRVFLRSLRERVSGSTAKGEELTGDEALLQILNEEESK